MESEPLRSAFLPGFLGTNLGDLAVTMGALNLLKTSGLSTRGTMIVPPLGRQALASWEPIARAFPELSLHQWDLRLSGLRSAAPPTIALLDDIVRSEALSTALLKSCGADGADDLYYTGGEHLFSLGEAEQDWNLLGRLLPHVLAFERGQRTVVLPSTFGPFESGFSQALIERFLRGASIVAARDETSAVVVERLGFRKPRFALDPAFFINCPGEGARAKTPVANLVMRLDGAGLRVGAKASAQTVEAFVEAGYRGSVAYRFYRELAEAFLAKGFAVRLFAQCNADTAVCRALRDDLNETLPEGRVFLAMPADLNEFVSRLSQGAVTITSRFHSAIFSMLVGCPVLGLYFSEHGHKMPGFFAGCGMAGACFNAREATPSAVLERARELQEDRAAQDRLANTLETLKHETIALYQTLSG